MSIYIHTRPLVLFLSWVPSGCSSRSSSSSPEEDGQEPTRPSSSGGEDNERKQIPEGIHVHDGQKEIYANRHF